MSSARARGEGGGGAWGSLTSLGSLMVSLRLSSGCQAREVAGREVGRGMDEREAWGRLVLKSYLLIA